MDEDTLLQTLGDAMSRYDTGVRTLSLHEVDGGSSLGRFAASSRDDLNEPPSTAVLKSLMNERGLYQRPSRNTAAPRLVELRTTHEGQSSDDPPIQLVDESDGTRRLLNLSPVLLARRAGQCVLIDELDRSLHAAAAQQFVREFLAARPDDQLLFTTHDTTLLDMPELPPACVWFVEKDASGCSSLHSLAEVKPEQLARFGGRFAAGYLQGRFGGVPHLRPIASGE